MKSKDVKTSVNALGQKGLKIDLMKKSVEVLKSLQVKNGGILATPIDGAYPYIYIRDGVIITKAYNRVGLTKNSERFYYFVDKFSKLENYKDIHHRYNVNGLPAVTRKHEHDCSGLTLHGIYDTYVYGKNKSFLEDMWPLIQKLVPIVLSYIKSEKGLIYTERSIQEFYRLEHGYEIWANCACCRGLYDASEIAKLLGHSKESKEWYGRAEKLHNNIKKKLFNKKTGMFMKNLRFSELPEMSQLSPFYFNLVDSKEILKKTMHHLQDTLWHKEIGGFRRFRKFEVVKDWHWYSGGSGSWSVFTVWGAHFYKQLKDKKRYNECLKWIRTASSRTNGLLPEHIATKEEFNQWKMNETEFNSRIIKEMNKMEKVCIDCGDDLVYWATPLGWAHAEYILLNKK